MFTAQESSHPHALAPSVREKKHTARQTILEYTLAQDQAAVIEQWVKTCIHSRSEVSVPEDVLAHQRAVDVMLFSMAAVLCGDFYVRHSETEAVRPSNVLTVADYFSHASRVVIDFHDLSEVNRQRIQALFSRDFFNARASTHFTERKQGELKERKSQRHGGTESLKMVTNVVGQMSGLTAVAQALNCEGPACTDFGVNIMMGGFGQPNVSGGYTAMGRDGHVLIHLPADDASLMIGLEQTQPTHEGHVRQILVQAGQSFRDLFAPQPVAAVSASSSQSTSPALESDDDETSGLTGHHSLLGHADDYTAAGSLYFSNVLYKTKLFEATGTLTPVKYNGMRVQLNDACFDAVMRVFEAMQAAKEQQEEQTLRAYLSALPQSHHPSPVNGDQNLMTFFKDLKIEDLKASFKQIEAIYDESLATDYTSFCNKLVSIQTWMKGEDLRDESPLVIFYDGEIRSQNMHVQRLKAIFNRCIQYLEVQVKDQLTQKLQAPGTSLEELLLLNALYSRQTNEVLLQQDDHYRELTQTALEYLRLQASMKMEQNPAAAAEDDDLAVVCSPERPFKTLQRLKSLEASAESLVSTNESKLLVTLAKAYQSLSKQTAPVLGAIHDASVPVKKPRRMPRPKVRMPKKVKPGHHQPVAAHIAPPDVPNVHLVPLVPPVVPPLVVEDWAWWANRMLAAENLNLYGAVWMVLGLALVSATALAVIPVVSGVTGAIVSVAVGCACFFQASVLAVGVHDGVGRGLVV